VDECDPLPLRGRPSQVSRVPESGSPTLPYDAGCGSLGSQVFDDLRRVCLSLDPDDEDFPRQHGLVVEALQTTTKPFGPLPRADDDAETTVHQRRFPRGGVDPTCWHRVQRTSTLFQRPPIASRKFRPIARPLKENRFPSTRVRSPTDDSVWMPCRRGPSRKGLTMATCSSRNSFVVRRTIRFRTTEPP